MLREMGVLDPLPEKAVRTPRVASTPRAKSASWRRPPRRRLLRRRPLRRRFPRRRPRDHRLPAAAIRAPLTLKQELTCTPCSHQRELTPRAMPHALVEKHASRQKFSALNLACSASAYADRSFNQLPLMKLKPIKPHHCHASFGCHMY